MTIAYSRTKIRRAGQILRRWRMRQGLIVQDCIQRVPVNTASWSQWEKGQNRPSFDNAIRIELLTSGLVNARMWDFSDDLFQALRVLVPRWDLATECPPVPIETKETT